MQLTLNDQPLTGGPVVVRAPGHFVAANASVMHSLLVDAIERGDCRAVDLDCTDTHYIDSAAIGAVIAAHKRFVRTGGEIRWTGVSDEVASLLEVTRVDRMMFIRRRPVAS